MSRLLRFLRAIRSAGAETGATTSFGEQLDRTLQRDEGVTLRAETLERALVKSPRRRAVREESGALRRGKGNRRPPATTLQV